MTATAQDVVRRFFDCYLTQDLEMAQQLAAEDLVFTSPQDDHIDRDAYFERCFPTSSRLRSQELQLITAANDEDVFVMYEYELLGGGRYRNAELITVRHRRIVNVQVFFGGAVTASQRPPISASGPPTI